MSVHAKNPTSAEEQKAKIMQSVAAASVISENQPTKSDSPVFTQTVTPFYKSTQTHEKASRSVPILKSTLLPVFSKYPRYFASISVSYFY